MINKMKNINKSVVPATMAVLVVFGMFAPAFLPVANAASFNQGSQPYQLLRSHNYSENGSCSSCWLDNNVTAGIGDIVSFQVFYNNTSDEIADDVEITIEPSVASDGDSVTVTATISADNASDRTDSLTINAESGDNIEDLEQAVSAWHEDGLGGTLSISNASNIESGSGIGDIVPGDENSGFVYVRFRVLGDEDNDDDDDDDNDNDGDAPRIIDVEVEDIDDDSAVLICEVDPNEEDTDVWFEWSDDEDEVEDGDGEKTNVTDVDGDESSETVERTITGLDEDTEYFFICFAENDEGDDESGVEEFTTDENGGSGDEPDVTTLSATGVTTASAVIRGEVDPNGEDTDVWFEWGTSSTNLNRETSTEDAGDGTNDVDFDRTITGLSPNTLYFFRAVGESNEGIDRGNILSFRTGTVAPATVITQIVERIVDREPEPEPEGLIITLDVDTRNIDDDEVRYTISYENKTDETFTNAELIVEIPNELEFVDADPTEDDEDGDDLFFTIGTITPGEEDSFIVDTEVQNDVDENDEILFVANVEYTDSGTRKIVTAKHNMTLAEARNGFGFGAFIGGAFGDFFTNPLLWLLILLLVIFFVYRYFANLARPKEAPVYIREPFPPAVSRDDS